MVNKIIAILLALLVIVGMVSCAADKKNPAEGEEEEEQADPIDPAAMDLTDEQIAEKANYFVTALYSPNVMLLVDAVNPDVLTYMMQVEGKSEEDLRVAIAQADADIRDTWASRADGLDYTSLVREHSYRQLTEAELQDINTVYADIPLTVDCAIAIDIAMSYEEMSLGSFTVVMVKIDGQWWLDPFHTQM